MEHVLPAVVVAALCALGGLLVPALIARVPEPAAEPVDDADREPDQPAPPDAEVVPTYVSVAARSGLRWRAAAVSAAAGGLVGASLGWDRALVGLAPLVPVCVALGIIDLHTRRLPRLVVLPATAVLLALVLVDSAVRGDHEILVRSLAGMLAVRTIYWLLWWLHSAGMGFGDVRLAALLALATAYLGQAELLLGVYAGFVVFAVPGLLLALVRRDRGLLRAAYPFGPAMMVGALAGVVLVPALS